MLKATPSRSKEGNELTSPNRTPTSKQRQKSTSRNPKENANEAVEPDVQNVIDGYNGTSISANMQQINDQEKRAIKANQNTTKGSNSTENVFSKK